MLNELTIEREPTEQPRGQQVFVVMYQDKHDEGPCSAHRTEAGAERAMRGYVATDWANDWDLQEEAMPADLYEARDRLAEIGCRHYWIDDTAQLED